MVSGNLLWHAPILVCAPERQLNLYALRPVMRHPSPEHLLFGPLHARQCQMLPQSGPIFGMRHELDEQVRPCGFHDGHGLKQFVYKAPNLSHSSGFRFLHKKTLLWASSRIIWSTLWMINRHTVLVTLSHRVVRSNQSFQKLINLNGKLLHEFK